VLGLVAGLATALFFGEQAAWLKTVGAVFIGLLQIALLPYLMGSLIVALGSLSLNRAKQVCFYAGGLLLGLWAIAIATVLMMSLALPNWVAASFFSTAALQQPVQPNLMQLFIPSNPFYALANGVVPAVVVFSILLAAALMRVPGKESVIAPLKVLTQALMGITRMVSALTPYGIFAVTAGAAATLDVSDLARLQVYIVIYTAVALVLGLWLLPALVAALTPLRFAAVSRELRAPLLTALATSSVTITLPLIMAAAQQLIDQYNASARTPPPPAGPEESPVEILVPAAYNFPDIAQVLSLFFVVFAGWYVGARLTLTDSMEAMALGLPSLFGGRTLTIPMLLRHFELPSDLFQLFITADVLIARLGAMLGAGHLAALALIGSFAMQQRLTLRPAAALSLAVKTLILLLALLIGIRAFYTYGVVAPYTKDQALKSLALPIEPRSPTVISQEAARANLPANRAAGPEAISQIRSRGLIRACFVEDQYPRAFFNTAQPPQLVGFDIEMGLRFARELRVQAHFVPVSNVGEAAQLLTAGACDVLMSAQVVQVDALEHFVLSTPVFQSAVSFLTHDAKSTKLGQWSQMLGEPPPRFAVMSSELSFAQTGLERARLSTIDSSQALRTLLEAGAPNVDGIVMPSEMAAAFSLLYPSFAVVVPKPAASLQMAYAVAPGNDSLLRVLDAWIVSTRASGIVDQAHEYWIAGGAFKSQKAPRWSVLRNVLGWQGHD
jgi:Na+/H+-dicarboxylate symporter